MIPRQCVANLKGRSVAHRRRIDFLIPNPHLTAHGLAAAWHSVTAIWITSNFFMKTAGENAQESLSIIRCTFKSALQCSTKINDPGRYRASFHFIIREHLYCHIFLGKPIPSHRNPGLGLQRLHASTGLEFSWPIDAGNAERCLCRYVGVYSPNRVRMNPTPCG